ncbi:MAG: dus, partial [Phycisphaerales bacterium]|nr:dus [Phycisphaerales bacterium]
FACPVKKIKNKARGGHMLRDLPRGLAILRAVRERLPTATLTVSLRRSFGDEGHETLFGLLDEAWQLGYSAARVHARSVEQKYFGRADWSALAEIKRQYPDRTILGSGDVFTAQDAVRMKRETGVDIVWIARGAIGNPWIFQHAAELLRVGATHASPGLAEQAQQTTHASPLQDAIQPPPVAEQGKALREHWDESLALHGEQLTGRRMRKQGIKYARFHPEADQVKKQFVNISSITDFARVIDTWYADDRPGVWPAVDAADEVNAGAAESAAGNSSISCGIGE